MLIITPPKAVEYPIFMGNYIGKIEETDLLPKLIAQKDEIAQFIDSIPPDRYDFRYAPGKWSIKEVIGHMIDTERIFAYRALCIARKEPQTLPSFEEKDYAGFSNAGKREVISLKKEMLAVRESSILLFDSFEEEMVLYTGNVGSYQASVRAFGYAIAGHVEHHNQIIKERYLG